MKDSEINLIQPSFISFQDDEWKELFLKKNSERPNYSFENGELKFGQVVGRFIGIPFEEEVYYNTLYEMKKEWNVEMQILEGLDKTLEQKHYQSLQEIVLAHKRQGLTINRMMAFIQGKSILPTFKSPFLTERSKFAFRKLLEHYEAEHENGLKEQAFYRQIVEWIKWLKEDVGAWVYNMKNMESMPKIVWYGDMTESETYFLLYLMYFGCDVLIFNPNGKDAFETVNMDMTKVIYPKKAENKPFPTQRMKITSTIAYNASQQISHTFRQEGVPIYKPWQLRDYVPMGLMLKTTYDEIFIVGVEKAYFRPGFEVTGEDVFIPALFAKVNGISKNKKEYWDKMQELGNKELSLTIKNFPFAREVQQNYRVHFYQNVNREGLLDANKLVNADWWVYKQLNGGLQKGIANAISRICYKPQFKAVTGESQSQLQLYLFKQAMAIPESILRLMQRFDYSQEVPKIILYNTEQNGVLSREDAALLYLLHEIGFDIIVYNPPGQNDIENYIDAEMFETHWLEDIAFEQEYKEQSIFKKLFNRLI